MLVVLAAGFVDGNYNVTTEGQGRRFMNSRLAFDHQSSYGFLVWLFVAVFVVSLIDLAPSVTWVACTGQKAFSAMLSQLLMTTPAMILGTH